MLLHLALMAFPTTFYLRSLMSSTTWRQRPRKPQNLMCNGGDLAWDFIFSLSFWKLISNATEWDKFRKNVQFRGTIFLKQSLKLKIFMSEPEIHNSFNSRRLQFWWLIFESLNFYLDFWISTYEKVWKTNKNTYLHVIIHYVVCTYFFIWNLWKLRIES